MVLVDDFFNKVVNRINLSYFPDVKYYKDNRRCSNIHYMVENFNNGVIKYDKLIKFIAKNCRDSESNIHKIVSEYIEEWD